MYADTALASRNEIEDYLNNFVDERILFGSDFPFGDPKEELSKVLHLSISPEKKNQILSLNLLRLLDSGIQNLNGSRGT